MFIKAIAVSLALFTIPAAGKGPVVGQKAIDFELQNFRGERVTLSQYRGKIVLLDFWASWCGPCKEEMPFLDLLQKTYGKSDFAVVAVNIDERLDNALRFLEQNQVKLMPLWDGKKKVVSAYDVAAMPTSMIIDQDGWIRFLHSGFEAEDFGSYKKEIEGLLRRDTNRAAKRGRPRSRAK